MNSDKKEEQPKKNKKSGAEKRKQRKQKEAAAQAAAAPLVPAAAVAAQAVIAQPQNTALQETVGFLRATQLRSQLQRFAEEADLPRKKELIRTAFFGINSAFAERKLGLLPGFFKMAYSIDPACEVLGFHLVMAQKENNLPSGRLEKIIQALPLEMAEKCFYWACYGWSPDLVAKFFKNTKIHPELPLTSRSFNGKVERELLENSPFLKIIKAAVTTPDKKLREKLLEIIPVFFEHGAEINRPIIVENSFGLTALEFATHSKDRPLVQLILKHNPDLDAVRMSGETVLMWAAHAGNLDIFKDILNAGADPDFQDFNGDTADSIAEKKHPHIAEFLREWRKEQQIKQQAEKQRKIKEQADIANNKQEISICIQESQPSTSTPSSSHKILKQLSPSAAEEKKEEEKIVTSPKPKKRVSEISTWEININRPGISDIRDELKLLKEILDYKDQEPSSVKLKVIRSSLLVTLGQMLEKVVKLAETREALLPKEWAVKLRNAIFHPENTTLFRPNYNLEKNRKFNNSLKRLAHVICSYINRPNHNTASRPEELGSTLLEKILADKVQSSLSISMNLRFVVSFTKELNSTNALNGVLPPRFIEKARDYAYARIDTCVKNLGEYARPLKDDVSYKDIISRAVAIGPTIRHPKLQQQAQLVTAAAAAPVCRF